MSGLSGPTQRFVRCPLMEAFFQHIAHGADNASEAIHAIAPTWSEQVAFRQHITQSKQLHTTQATKLLGTVAENQQLQSCNKSTPNAPESASDYLHTRGFICVNTH